LSNWRQNKIPAKAPAPSTPSARQQEMHIVGENVS
jgi:hypothetical protein